MQTTVIKEDALVLRSKDSLLSMRPENTALPFSRCIFHSHYENP